MWYRLCQCVKKVGFEKQQRKRENQKGTASQKCSSQLCSRETRPWLKITVGCCAEFNTLQRQWFATMQCWIISVNQSNICQDQPPGFYQRGEIIICVLWEPKKHGLSYWGYQEWGRQIWYMIIHKAHVRGATHAQRKGLHMKHGLVHDSFAAGPAAIWALRLSWQDLLQPDCLTERPVTGPCQSSTNPYA